MNHPTAHRQPNHDDGLARYVTCSAQRRRLYVGDLSLHYIQAGEGRPIVLLHGLNMGWGQWYQNIAGLVVAGYQVYALDLPGSGQSDDMPSGTEPVAGQVAAVRGWLQRLGLHDVTVVAHSLGAVIALNLAQEPGSEVSRLVLESPLGFTNYIPLNQRPATLRPLARLLANTVFGPGYRGIRRFLESAMFQPQNLPAPFVAYYVAAIQTRPHSHPLEIMSRLSRRLAMQPQLTVADRLGGVTIPVLILAGAHDHIVPVERVAREAHRLPRAQFEVVLGAGHVPNLEQPHEFNRRIEHFMATGGGV